MQDVYVGTIYLSPNNSTYNKKLDYSPFDMIEHEVAKMSNKGQVVLMGDFNARTGVCKEFITPVNSTLIPEANCISYDDECV